MGYKQLRVSDISGVELSDKEAVEVTVKSASKKFDCSTEELKAFKPIANVVELEVKNANGEVSTVLVTKTEFSKLIPEDKLASFDSSRGRRSGFSPRSNGQPTAQSAGEA